MSQAIFDSGDACVSIFDFVPAFIHACTHAPHSPPADTPLFSCQCARGKEREVICDVMAKCVQPLAFEPVLCVDV